MKIITLIEDSKQDENLVNEFGLSLYIEVDGVKILLDTGTTGNFIKNTKNLGVDLEDVDFVIISHAHFDHGGGLDDTLETNKTAIVYMHEDCRNEYYGNIGAKLPPAINFFVHPFVKRSMVFSKYIGLNQQVLSKHKKRIKFISKTIEITKNVFLVTNISKKNPIPEGNKFILKQKNGRLELDDFNHELILVVKEEDGVVLFSGCCHSGLLNMIETVKKLFKDQSIKAVIGGFHLKFQPGKDNLAGTEKDIQDIAKELINQKIQRIYTGHCTGKKAYSVLEKVLKDRIGHLFTGAIIQT
ncbi:MAG: MBL fold metallo-hydrolase [Desulfobacterales bacterium]|nr:MBL fold metallo-hydrolase [Desulfobacterales bacterium]